MLLSKMDLALSSPDLIFDPANYEGEADLVFLEQYPIGSFVHMVETPTGIDYETYLCPDGGVYNGACYLCKKVRSAAVLRYASLVWHTELQKPFYWTYDFSVFNQIVAATGIDRYLRSVQVGFGESENGVSTLLVEISGSGLLPINGHRKNRQWEEGMCRRIAALGSMFYVSEEFLGRHMGEMGDVPVLLRVLQGLRKVMPGDGSADHLWSKVFGKRRLL